jgi:hypothetical protein
MIALMRARAILKHERQANASSTTSSARVSRVETLLRYAMAQSFKSFVHVDIPPGVEDEFVVNFAPTDHISLHRSAGFQSPYP